MKRLTGVLALAILCNTVTAQEDSVIVKERTRDTTRIGNILIIKKGGRGSGKDSSIVINRTTKSRSGITTQWFVFDLGISNYNDATNYANTGSFLVNRPGAPEFSESDFKLRGGKSINVNIWFFMQKVNLIKQNVNLKYGLGLELNNYRYRSAISYRENGIVPYSGGMETNRPFIFRDSISFSKNKLAADYLTIPVMLNFTTTPANSRKAIGFSAGISAGYLYSQRNKQKSEERGKQKNKGDYDLERFKLSYVGELKMGPVTLYGSYSPKSMYENSLDMRPYTIGVRF